MPNNKAKTITQGAAMLALFLIFFALSMYVPLINMIAFLVAPIPIAWFSAQVSRSDAAIFSALALFASVLIGGFIGPFIALILIVVGFAIGDAIRTKKSKLYLFLSASLSLLFTFALLFVVLVQFFNFNFVDQGFELTEESYREALAYTAEQTGREIPSENLELLMSQVKQSIPAAVTLGVFFMSFMMVSICLFVLKRLQLNVPKFPPFHQMRLPKSVLWYYLIILTINFFVKPESGTMLFVITLNVAIVLWVLLTFQGISFIHYVIDAFKYPAFLKGLTVIMAIPLYSFVVLLGIIDLGFNVRQYIDMKSQR